MSLAPGDTLGHYRIVDTLGAGGMGEVYRARDTKLNRDVALKVLPQTIATDPERLARFHREAHVLASLNHPNIAQIYDAQTGDAAFLTMELVPGATLADIIDRDGALAPDEVAAIARQIAEGLEAAHEAGVIHRDLKPANIKRRDDGVVKILDFGLARAVEAGTGALDMSSPTMLSPAATQGGVILGTAGYMSPEQAKGRPVDKRADIWAFGVVLYELLTGSRLFRGETITEVIASVIKEAPDLNALPNNTPRVLRQLIARSLERDPKTRLRDIGEARIMLDRAGGASADAERAAVVRVSDRWSGPRWLVAGLAVGMSIAALGWWVWSRQSPIAAADPIVARFQLTLPADMQLTPLNAGSFSVSPDGTSLVFSATKSGTSQLWIRAIDSTDVKALPGTEGGTLPFWSPDGAHLGFFASNNLKRIDLRTNAVLTICPALSPGGGTWNADGVIVFSPKLEGPLHRVPAGGGNPAQLTALDETGVESNHMWPHFLPDGRHYLFQVLGLTNRGLYVGRLDSTERTLVVKQDQFDMTAVQYSATGHIVYVRNHQLVARPFDLETFRSAGDETVLAEGFGIGGPGRPPFSVSRTGVLAFRPSGERPMVQPTWFNRSGTRISALNLQGPYSAMELSPDERTLAVDQFAEKESLIWLIDLNRGTASRFTTDPYSVNPKWFPAGDRIAFTSVRDTPPNPFVRTLSGAETRLARVVDAVFLGSVSPDGQTIIASMDGATTDSDLWLFSAISDAPPKIFLQTPYTEQQARISPDGRWVAFTSNASGADEIYVTSFPTAGRPIRVSAERGVAAVWANEGREIIFRSRNRIIAAPFSVSASGEPNVGALQELFALPENAGAFVVADKGQRFLINLEVKPRQISPMTIVLNGLQSPSARR